jgi:hypothetical protein
MVEKMHWPTSNKDIIVTTWRNIGTEHPEQYIIKGKEIGSLSRFAPGVVETLDLVLVVLGGVKMQVGTSRKVNTIECVTQELPKASEGRVSRHLISHPCEANMILSIKL